MHPDESPTEGGNEDDLYNQYLDSALEGNVPEPSEFLAAHPGAGAVLHERLAALHRMLASTRPRGGRAAPLAAEAGLPFERLGEYRLIRSLGTGGMGVVYLAEQESLSRIVALKVVRAELQGSPIVAERFRREAVAIARLRHENIVAVHTVGEDRGVLWIAMEYVEGRGLDEILAEAAGRGLRIPASDAVRWAARIARALHAAHAAAIVHRDVKPSNVRITPEGRPVLIDFGIARELGADAMTRSAPFIGSPYYAAPEQIAGEAGAADARTDVHSLGITLYECLAGRAPWNGGTVEQVFRAILTVDPPRLRSVDPAIARDLEIVVAKAIEKEPGRRYATAADFADDLEALLEFRPIRARPPSPAARIWAWARRRPGPAAAAATVTVALAAFGVLAVVQNWSAAQARRDEAATTLSAARDRVASYRERRAASQAVERRVHELRDLLASRFVDPAEERLLDEHEDAIAGFQRDREAVYHEVLDLVRRAESLDAAVAGADLVRAELYREKWREAMDAADPAAAAHYRDRLVAADPHGKFSAEVARAGWVEVETDPPGAEVHVFRYAEQGELEPRGEKRLVPVPVGGAAAVPPGTWAFEVTADRADLRRGDIVVQIDGTAVRDRTPAATRAIAARGGGAARLVREGRILETTLPPGLRGRVTAAPLLPSPATQAGTSPLPELRLEPGSYVLLLRHPGFEDVRRPVRSVAGAGAIVKVQLVPEGTTAEGFVRVEGGVLGLYWIMEREVTAADYLEFLNDLPTLAEIDASPDPVRFPRGLTSHVCGSPWPRGEGGRFAIAPDWLPDWPILGVSVEDARAFAAWRTARARAAGRTETYRLPTHDEWVAAAHGSGDRQYPYGDRFRPRWAKGCFARPNALPEPVLSYPVDESPAGAFDLSGSVSEWCDSWYDEGRRLHRLAGGSWARGFPYDMKIWTPRGEAAGFASGETGFRLVIRPPEESR